MQKSLQFIPYALTHRVQYISAEHMDWANQCFIRCGALHCAETEIAYSTERIDLADAYIYIGID